MIINVVVPVVMPVSMVIDMPPVYWSAARVLVASRVNVTIVSASTAELAVAVMVTSPPSSTDVGFAMLEALGEGTGSTVDLTRDERGERYFLDLLDRRPVDRLERSRRNGLLSHYGNYLGLAVLSGSSILLEPMAGLFERADDW